MITGNLNDKTLHGLFSKQLPQQQMSLALINSLQQQVLFAVATTFPPPAAVKRPVALAPYANWREEQRFLAWEFKQQGWKQSRIAEVLEVNPCTVSRWLKRAHGGGQEALRNSKRLPMYPRLSVKKLRCLPGLLARLVAEDVGAQEGMYAPLLFQ